jgi:hypothetical protein
MDIDQDQDQGQGQYLGYLEVQAAATQWLDLVLCLVHVLMEVQGVAVEVGARSFST